MQKIWHYQGMDPVAFQLGPLAVHWYGLMYLLAFVLCWALAAKRLAPDGGISSRALESLVFYCILGVVLGGRLGYALFYAWGFWQYDPLWLVKIWKGGMSFHGGAIGVCLATWLFARKHRLAWGRVLDFIVPLVPIGLGLGRLGNFINQELWGRPSDWPWAVVFSADPKGLPRHPTQLYEMFLEGILLFVILDLARRFQPARWTVTGIFAIGYGVFRFVIEFWREPDVILTAGLTRGQILCVPMVVLGAVIIYRANRKRACRRT